MGQFMEEGLQDVLEVYFATPGDYYIGLATDASIAKDAAYTDLTEVSGSGYALIQLDTMTVTVLLSDDRKATGNQVTFSATGDWTTAIYWFMITPAVDSGTYTLVCANQLDTPTTLTSGETINVTPIVNANG